MTNIFFLVINGESREGLGRGLGGGGVMWMDRLMEA